MGQSLLFWVELKVGFSSCGQVPVVGWWVGFDTFYYYLYLAIVVVVRIIIVVAAPVVCVCW